MSEAAATQAAIGDSEFDRDTAVTPRPPGVYDIDLSAGWTIISAVNGGSLLAVLGRALADTLPHPDPFTVSAHHLTASQPGPAVIRTDTVRTGRTLSTGQASLFQYDDEGNDRPHGLGPDGRAHRPRPAPPRPGPPPGLHHHPEPRLRLPGGGRRGLGQRGPAGRPVAAAGPRPARLNTGLCHGPVSALRPPPLGKAQLRAVP